MAVNINSSPRHSLRAPAAAIGGQHLPAGAMPPHVMNAPWLVRAQGSMRYTQLDPAGRGAYGTVYLALDRLTDNSVAIKRQSIPCDTASREMAIVSL